MLNTDPKRPLARIVAVFAGLAVFGWGMRAVLGQHNLHYQNWFGELIFAPLAILFGLVIIFGALFKPEILSKAPMSRKH
jgi:uncharacterized membrane protein YdjX (TVP38/TMEM64 family)